MQCIRGFYGLNRPFLGYLDRKNANRSASWICELRRNSLQCRQVESKSYFVGVESQPPKTISLKSAIISGKLPASTTASIYDTTNIGHVRPGSGRGFLRFFSGTSPAEPELGERAVVERGVVSPPRKVPDHIPKTPYYATGIVPPSDSYIYLHTPESLSPMREACTLARDMLDLCCEMAQPGVTTDEIDAIVHSAIVEAGACPSPLNYHGFPKSLCSSVNEVACHAIPDDRPLQDGDIVSFDVSVFLKGFHGDNCATVGVGKVDDAAHRLMDATKEGMMAGVSVCRPGACITEIGSAIHDVADRYGYETVQKYCGHGVGASFHMLPFVEHFRNNRKLEMVPGMTFTIEPIFTEGKQATTTWSDEWTVQTIDGSRAAQFEHVVLITEEGHEILTVPSRPP